MATKYRYLLQDGGFTVTCFPMPGTEIFNKGWEYHVMRVKGLGQCFLLRVIAIDVLE